MTEEQRGMPDIEKVIRGWERCRQHTCPALDSEEYKDCEYTVGLYCGQDRLIDETIELLKKLNQKAMVCSQNPAQRDKPEPMPEPAVYYDRPESRYPDQIRLSFPDGKTIVYDRRIKQPSPKKYLNMPRHAKRG